MPKIVWDQVGEKLYEAGVDHCVLYLQNSSGAYPEGVAWNGITSISESPSGADEQKFYADNIVYGSIRGTEDFGATIEAFTYPDEWELCDGSASPVKGVHIGQQTRKPFGLSYRTLIGNDTDGLDHGYKIHLIYNATVSPSEKTRPPLLFRFLAQTRTVSLTSLLLILSLLRPISKLRLKRRLLLILRKLCMEQKEKTMSLIFRFRMTSLECLP